MCACRGCYARSTPACGLGGCRRVGAVVRLTAKLESSKAEEARAEARRDLPWRPPTHTPVTVSVERASPDRLVCRSSVDVRRHVAAGHELQLQLERGGSPENSALTSRPSPAPAGHDRARESTPRLSALADCPSSVCRRWRGGPRCPSSGGRFGLPFPCCSRQLRPSRGPLPDATRPDPARRPSAPPVPPAWSVCPVADEGRRRWSPWALTLCPRRAREEKRGKQPGPLVHDGRSTHRGTTRRRSRVEMPAECTLAVDV